MLRILKSDFTIKSVINNSTFLYNDKFADVGNFEFTLPSDQIYPDIKNGVFIKFKDIYGIVRYYDACNEKYTVKGYDLKGLLKQRVVQPSEYTGTPEYVIKQLVMDNCTIGNRAFPLFIAEEVRDTTSGDVTYKIDSPKQLDVIINELCQSYDLGYTVKFNGTNIIFDTVTPTTRNVSYSAQKRNFADYNYSYDALTYANLVYNRCYSTEFEVDAEITSTFTNQNTGDIYNNISFSAKGGTVYKDGNAYKVGDMGSASFSSRDYRYAYIFIGVWNQVPRLAYLFGGTSSTADVVIPIAYVYGSGRVEILDTLPTTKSIYMSDTEPTGYERCEIANEFKDGETDTEMQSACNLILKENSVNESVSTSIITNDDYKDKWYLGDYIKVKVNALNQQLIQTSQVSEVQQAWEDGKYKLTPTFGKVRENIYKTIMKRI